MWCPSASLFRRDMAFIVTAVPSRWRAEETWEALGGNKRLLAEGYERGYLTLGHDSHAQYSGHAGIILLSMSMS
jgi:hypothetical protein